LGEADGSVKIEKLPLRQSWANSSVVLSKREKWHQLSVKSPKVICSFKKVEAVVLWLKAIIWLDGSNILVQKRSGYNYQGNI
jgi:hypothetical protein